MQAAPNLLPLDHRPTKHRRAVVSFAAGLAVIGMVGTAIASGRAPFSGIDAVGHTQTPPDTLSPAVVDQLKADVPPLGSAFDQIGARDTGSTRLVGTLPSGRNVYIVPTSKGRLCVVVATLAESCGDPLTQASPITFTVIDPGSSSGQPPIAYGVARDGVVSVSFTVAGNQLTVPVQNNFYVYEANPWDQHARFSSPTVTFADGSTQVAR